MQNKFKIAFAELLIFICTTSLVFNAANNNIFQVLGNSLGIMLGIQMIYSISNTFYLHVNKIRNYFINKKVLFTTKYRIVVNATTMDSIIVLLNKILCKNNWHYYKISRNKFSNTITYDALINRIPIKLKVIVTYTKDNKMILNFKLYFPIKYRQIRFCLNEFNLFHKKICNKFKNKESSKYIMYIANKNRVFNPYIRIKLNNLGSYYISFKYHNVKIKADLHKLHFESSDKKQINKILEYAVKPF